MRGRRSRSQGWIATNSRRSCWRSKLSGASLKRFAASWSGRPAGCRPELPARPISRSSTVTWRFSTSDCEAFKPESLLPPTAFELAIGDFTVSGSFSHLTPEGLLFYRPAAIKAKDLLRAWVEHLLWNAIVPKGRRDTPDIGTRLPLTPSLSPSEGERFAAGRVRGPLRTVIVGTESIWKLAPVSDPLLVLEGLLERYWSGLSEPLRFFPESSFAFAAADHKAASGTKGRTARTPLDFAVGEMERQ